MASSIDNLINVAFRKGQDLSGFGLKVGGKGDYRPPQFDAESLKFEYIDANESYGIDLNGSRFLQKLTFAESQDFTRATTGTFIGSNGLIQTAAIDAPRFTHDPVTREVQGLLIEEQRTNVITRSQPTVADNYWQALTDTTLSDVTLAGLPALRVTRDTGTGGLQALITNTQGNSSNKCFRTMIVRVSDPANQYLKLRIAGDSGHWYYPNADSYHITFDLSSKTVVYAGSKAGTAEIKELSVGVFKLTLNQTSTSGGALAAGGWAFRLSDQSDASDYNTPQVPQGSWFEFTACQREELVGYPTSYIPTAGTQVTRAADDCVRVLGAEFNPNEGTLYYEGVVVDSSVGGSNAFKNVLALYEDTGNRIAIIGTSLGVRVFDGSSYEDMGVSFGAVGDPVRYALAYSGLTWRLVLNGAVVGNGTGNFDAQAFTTYSISQAQGSLFPALVKDTRLFPTALSDDELITLTGGT